MGLEPRSFSFISSSIQSTVTFPGHLSIPFYSSRPRIKRVQLTATVKITPRTTSPPSSGQTPCQATSVRTPASSPGPPLPHRCPPHPTQAPSPGESPCKDTLWPETHPMATCRCQFGIWICSSGDRIRVEIKFRETSPKKC